MILEPYTAAVLAILFLAALCRSTFGFGDALIAMPLLSLTVDVSTRTFARPLVALLIAVTSATIAIRSRRTTDWKSARSLLLAAALGIPFGILYLHSSNERLVKAALGMLVILFSLLGICRWKLPEVHSKHAALLFGFVAGALGSAYNTHGPPLAIYGSLKRWTAEHFRATLQAYFFPASLLVVCADGANGLWSANVLWHFVYSLPLLAGAVLLGRHLNARFSLARFQFWLHLLLLGAGLALLATAIRLDTPADLAYLTPRELSSQVHSPFTTRSLRSSSPARTNPCRLGSMRRLPANPGRI